MIALVGMRFHGASLKPGDRVKVAKEVGNPYDPTALVVLRDGAKVAHVARDSKSLVTQSNWVVFELSSTGATAYAKEAP